jgi:predicted site-specific integrase-resolvase
MPTPFTDGLLKPEDVCERWEISRKTLGRWLKSGKIPGTREAFPCMKVGRKLRFSMQQIEYIESKMIRVARQRRSKGAA